MKRIFAKFALISFCFSTVVTASRADVCVSPRIKRAKACGVVIDPYGMRIPNARVRFGTAGSESSVVTDLSGKFSVAAQGDEVRLQVNAPGFPSVETTVGRLKPASEGCKKPSVFVMLTVGEQSCAMISSRKSDLLLAKKE